jgi:hypothetical protein
MIDYLIYLFTRIFVAVFMPLLFFAIAMVLNDIMENLLKRHSTIEIIWVFILIAAYISSLLTVWAWCIWGN